MLFKNRIKEVRYMDASVITLGVSRVIRKSTNDR